MVFEPPGSKTHVHRKPEVICLNSSCNAQRNHHSMVTDPPAVVRVRQSKRHLHGFTLTLRPGEQPAPLLLSPHPIGSAPGLTDRCPPQFRACALAQGAPRCLVLTAIWYWGRCCGLRLLLRAWMAELCGGLSATWRTLGVSGSNL